MSKHVFLLIIFYLVSALGVKSANAASDKRVLILNSNSPVKSNYNTMVGELVEKSPDTSFFLEYMNCETTVDYQSWESWMKQLFTTMTSPIDAVLIIGNEAWDVYYKNCPESWRDRPVILACVNNYMTPYQKKGEQLSRRDMTPIENTFAGFNVSGYYLVDDVDSNIEFIHKLQPEVRKILYINDNLYDFAYPDSFYYKGDSELLVKVVNGRKYTTGNLLDEISTLDESSAVLTGGWFSDSEYNPHAYSMLHNELQRRHTRVVYSVQEVALDDIDHIGGFFISSKEMGRDLSRLLSSVLYPKMPYVPKFSKFPTEPSAHINKQAFLQSGLNERNLPQDVVFHNVQLSSLEKYRVWLWTFIIGALLLLVILAVFLFYRSGKARVYMQSTQHMKKLLESMPDTTLLIDRNLIIHSIINPQPTVLFDVQAQDLKDKNLSELVEFNHCFLAAVDIIKKAVKQCFASSEISRGEYTIERPSGRSYTHYRVVRFTDDEVMVCIHDITERVVKRIELERLKSFMQTILDNLPIGVMVKNVSDDFRYMYYNNIFQNMLGVNVSNLVEKNDFELNVEKAQEYVEDDHKVLNSDSVLTFDRAEYDENGEPMFWTQTKKKAISDNLGYKYIIAVISDISNLKRSEYEVKKIQRELSIAIDAGALAVWSYSVKLHRFENLHGCSLALYKRTLDGICGLIHPDYINSFKNMITSLEDGTVKKANILIRYSVNGTDKWVELYASRMKNGGSNVELIIGSERDVTSEIQKQQELKTSKDRLELSLKASGNTPWDYDVQKDELIYQKDRDDVRVLTGAQFLELVYADDQNQVEETFGKIFRGEAEIGTATYRMRTAESPEYRWFENHIIITEHNALGKPSKITGLMKDITEEKNMTAELIQLRDKAEESSRLKGAFLANMSHEIRTPLNAIIGFANMVAEATNPADKKQFLGIMQSNCTLLLQLISDILDISKIESGHLDFSFTEWRFDDIFNELEKVYQMRIPKNVSFVKHLPATSIVVNSDKNRLTQVVSNFLSNAIKYTTEGSITFGYKYTDSAIYVFVSDTGKGIAKEYQDKVFTRFGKFDSTVSGNGLGLSICRQIVETLKGEAGFESTPGVGSTFWFKLPVDIIQKKIDKQEVVQEEISNIQPAVSNLSTEKEIADSEAVESQIPLDAKSEDESPAKSAKARILVAEDNDSNYLLLSLLLKKNFQLTRAVNGVEAVKMCESESPDIVLMDMKMPEMDGLEATRTIRQTNKKVPIIALTAHAYDDDKGKAIEAGCNDFLTKPVDIKALMKAMIKLL